MEAVENEHTPVKKLVSMSFQESLNAFRRFKQNEKNKTPIEPQTVISKAKRGRPKKLVNKTP